MNNFLFFKNELYFIEYALGFMRYLFSLLQNYILAYKSRNFGRFLLHFSLQFDTYTRVIKSRPQYDQKPTLST